MKVGYYIPSRHRADKQHTARLLERAGLPYKVFVEDNDYEAYCRELGENNVINLGGNDYGHVTYARNAIKEYSISQGEDWHWNIDDDMRHVYRLSRGKNISVCASQIIPYAEEFVQRYTNVGIAALAANTFNAFTTRPFDVNQFCYGFMLVKNDHRRWTAGVEDDLDYNLQVLTEGECTISFKAFSFYMSPQNAHKGGMTDIRTTERRNKWIENTIAKWPQLSMTVTTNSKGEPRVNSSAVWRKFNHGLIKK